MQRDQGEGILDHPGLEHGEGLVGALDDDLDVFAFIGKAVDAAGLAGIDAAAEEIDGFGRAARAGQEAVDRQNLADDGKPVLILYVSPSDRDSRSVTAVAEWAHAAMLKGGRGPTVSKGYRRGTRHCIGRDSPILTAVSPAGRVSA